jgi:hypothetical protein
VATGAQLGNYKLPRFFGEDDHSTTHNYNFVPGVDCDIWSLRPITAAPRWPM